MCNLYSVTKGQAAIIALTRAMRDTTGSNLPPIRRHPDQLDLGAEGEGGETVNDLFGFLTTEPKAEVGALSQAMPVILRTAQEIETWLTAPEDRLAVRPARMSRSSLSR